MFFPGQNFAHGPLPPKYHSFFLHKHLCLLCKLFSTSIRSGCLPFVDRMTDVFRIEEFVEHVFVLFGIRFMFICVSIEQKTISKNHWIVIFVIIIMQRLI